MNPLDDLNGFLDTFTQNIEELGVDVSSFNLDHAAFQASSSQDYEDKKVFFNEVGKLVNEALVSDRRVAIYKLRTPIEFKENEIIALEIIEPREGQICDSAWEHAEYVLTYSYDDLIKKYPDLAWDTSSVERPIYSHLKLKLGDSMQLKFHMMDILKAAELEKAQK